MKTLARLTAALIAGALLTACSDAPTTPAARPAPGEAPSAAVRGGQTDLTIPTARVVVRLVQFTDTAKAATSQRVTFYRGSDSVMVHDNAVGADMDARPGWIVSRLPLASSYTMRVTGGDPTFYRLGVAPKTAFTIDGVADFGTIGLHRSPWVVLKVVDGLSGIAVAGSEFSVSASNKPYMLFTDNKPGFDVNPTVGTLEYPFLHIGTLKFCESKIPTNYYALSPNCFTVDVPEWDKVYTKTVTYSPILKVGPIVF